MALLRARPFCFSAFLLFCFFCFLWPFAKAGDLQTDAEALLAFSSKLDGSSSSSALASWNASATDGVCTNWKGVSCGNASTASGNTASSSQLRVVAVGLPNASLSGQISASTLGLLDALQNLSLSSNQFYGDLPSDLANCSSLRSLLLQSNAFSGSLPPSLFSWWPLLEEIDLSFNKLNGSIPPSISQASSLQSVYLQNNSFSGGIPDITSSHLESFNVANNDLEGGIPPSLAKFSASSFSGNAGLCGSPSNETCLASDPSSNLSVGATVGIVFGAVLGGCFLLAAGKYVIYRRHMGRTSSARVNPKDNAEGAAYKEAGNAISMQTVGQKEIKGGVEEKVMGEPKLVLADDGEPGAFDIDALLRAPAEVMGNGSLGAAYKAILETIEKNELSVVVKRLNFLYRQDYEHHLRALAGLRHDSLIRIRAWYFFEDERLVVYDYLHGSNSLHALLHYGETILVWKMRLWVAGEVARAMAFMHGKEMMHGNIKSSNVLLDPEGGLGMADYGLVQLAIRLPRAAAAGNIGYTAPELLDLSKPTKETDVYSYGVLLLELLTGRNPLPTAGGGGRGSGRRSHGGEHVDLPRWVQSVVKEQWTAEVFDLQIMKHEFIQEEMMQLLQIALPCISPSPAQRPSMLDLAANIELLTQSDCEEGLHSP